MDSMNERAGQEPTQQSAEAADLIAELDEPALTSWASDDDLTPPEPPEFTTWDADLRPPEPVDMAPPQEVWLPPLFDDLPALPVGESATTPADDAGHGAAETRHAAPIELEHGDVSTQPPTLAAATDEVACAKDAHKRVRRDQMKEYATRLWIGGPQTPAVAAAHDPHLICTLADEDFALPLTGVLEVQRHPAVTPVPYMPRWLIGVTNRRGDVLSVVDMAGFLGREAAASSPYRRLVVVKASGEGLTTGLMVDRVRGIRGVAAGVIGPPSAAHAAAATPFVRGSFEHAGRTVAVLDLDDLLLSSRMRRLELD